MISSHGSILLREGRRRRRRRRKYLRTYLRGGRSKSSPLHGHKRGEGNIFALPASAREGRRYTSHLQPYRKGEDKDLRPRQASKTAMWCGKGEDIYLLPSGGVGGAKTEPSHPPAMNPRVPPCDGCEDLSFTPPTPPEGRRQKSSPFLRAHVHAKSSPSPLPLRGGCEDKIFAPATKHFDLIQDLRIQ